MKAFITWILRKYHNLKSHLLNYLRIFIILIYVGISHIVLPYFKKRDFFFFYQWNMFSFSPYTFVYDITCDQGKTFLIRDQKDQIKNVHSEIFLREIFHMIQMKNVNQIVSDFKEPLKRICKTDTILLVKMRGSLWDHIVLKKDLKIEDRVPL